MRRLARRSTSVTVPSPRLDAISVAPRSDHVAGNGAAPTVPDAKENRRPTRRVASGSQTVMVPSTRLSNASPRWSSTTPPCGGPRDRAVRLDDVPGGDVPHAWSCRSPRRRSASRRPCRPGRSIQTSLRREARSRCFPVRQVQHGDRGARMPAGTGCCGRWRPAGDRARGRTGRRSDSGAGCVRRSRPTPGSRPAWAEVRSLPSGRNRSWASHCPCRCGYAPLPHRASAPRVQEEQALRGRRRHADGGTVASTTASRRPSGAYASAVDGLSECRDRGRAQDAILRVVRALDVDQVHLRPAALAASPRRASARRARRRRPAQSMASSELHRRTARLPGAGGR